MDLNNTLNILEDGVVNNIKVTFLIVEDGANLNGRVRVVPRPLEDCVEGLHIRHPVVNKEVDSIPFKKNPSRDLETDFPSLLDTLPSSSFWFSSRMVTTTVLPN